MGLLQADVEFTTLRGLGSCLTLREYMKMRDARIGDYWAFKEADKEMMEEELMQRVEELLFLKWKDLPATQKQKATLRKLGIPHEKSVSKAQAFFLIRKEVDGVDLPKNIDLTRNFVRK